MGSKHMIHEAAIDEAVVVIVDDDKVLCDLLARRLERDEPDLVCGGVALEPASARVLVAETHPDVILMDGVSFHDRWPDARRIEPLKFASDLVKSSPSSHLLIWTAWSDPSPGQLSEIRLRVEAARAGAEALLHKGGGLDLILQEIRKAIRRGSPTRVAVDLLPDLLPVVDGEGAGEMRRVSGLTPAQARWASVLAQAYEVGMTVQEVAAKSQYSLATLRTHIRAIYNAWNVHSKVQFVDEARRRGLV